MLGERAKQLEVLGKSIQDEQYEPSAKKRSVRKKLEATFEKFEQVLCCFLFFLLDFGLHDVLAPNPDVLLLET